MKVLITGGCGFVGTNLALFLKSKNFNVNCLDNLSRKGSRYNLNLLRNKKIRNYKFDIRDYENTRPLYDGVDYVFHIAAEARIQPAIKNPIEAVSINSLGTCTVLQCAREAGVNAISLASEPK